MTAIKCPIAFGGLPRILVNSGFATENIWSLLVFSDPLALKQTSLGWGWGAFALFRQVRGLDPLGSVFLGDARSRGPGRVSPGRGVTVACKWRQRR